MNDSDLKPILKSVQLPERSEEYWDDFPAHIRLQLRRQQPAFRPQSIWRLRLAWAGGLALALALVWVDERFHPLETASNAITKQEHHFRAQVAQVKTGLRILMFNPYGMSSLLAEAN